MCPRPIKFLATSLGRDPDKANFLVAVIISFTKGSADALVLDCNSIVLVT